MTNNYQPINPRWEINFDDVYRQYRLMNASDLYNSYDRLIVLNALSNIIGCSREWLERELHARYAAEMEY